MIRTRLSFAFAAMVSLATAQGLFTLWATSSAARHAERSVVATSMLNHYLELGANKQRLKVWFAQSALASDAAEETKINLLAKMSRSLEALQTLAPRDAALNREDGDSEYNAVQLLANNFSVLKTSVQAVSFQPSPALASTSTPISASDQSKAWTNLISIFDRSDGRDMRSVLEQAVLRQRATSDLAKVQLGDALKRMRTASLLLALVSVGLGLFAVAYFVKRMHKPFDELVQSITAIAQGNYTHRVVKHPSSQPLDEFAQIAQQLNTVVVKLEAARDQSQRLRQGLDDTVAAKTADLTRSLEALLHIDIRRRQFFAEVSHELRTPVTVIRGEAEIALRGTHPAADYRASLGRIVDASGDLAKRVEDLLTLAKSDGQHYALQLQPALLSGVLRGALLQMSAVAANRNIELPQWTDVATPLLDSAWIQADQDRLQQALTIVLDNAVRYSPSPGRVSVDVVLDRDQQAVRIDVIDEGIGITPEECLAAFERHYRGKQARLMRPEGAGLGLSIAQTIVVAHDGEIMLRSNADQPHQSGTRGACVTIILPLLPQPSAEPL